MTQPSSYTSPLTTAILTNSVPTDYKALIGVFLYGATDSHNMLVPYGSNPNVAVYNSVRTSSVRMEQAEVANSILAGTNPQWALHPSLTHLRSRWSSGRLAILRDVGTLNEPTTRAQYLADKARYSPSGLFSHNTQQSVWQAALPFKQLRSTGWFGRVANLIDAIYNSNLVLGSSAVSLSGLNLQSTPYSPIPYIGLSPVLITALSTYVAEPTPTNLANLFSHISDTSLSPFNSPPFRKNNVMDAFRDIFVNGVSQQITVADNFVDLPVELASIFTAATSAASGLPDQYFLSQARNAVRTVISRGVGPGFGVSRQTIFMSSGGWDLHNNSKTTHGNKLRMLDIALKAMADCFEILGLDSSVTTFTQTDFGRTLRSNGTDGTDHAWAGHYFVTGGAVAGGMYGPEPDYTIGGPRSDDSSLGRFIPSISTEQYYATLLEWFGIPSDLIPLILPSASLFSPITLGFMANS
jgi:uncharacterized protein (DUF1501 family)